MSTTETAADCTAFILNPINGDKVTAVTKHFVTIAFGGEYQLIDTASAVDKLIPKKIPGRGYGVNLIPLTQRKRLKCF